MQPYKKLRKLIIFSSDLAVETFKETDANAAGWIAVVRKSIFAYHAITETEDFAG